MTKTTTEVKAITYTEAELNQIAELYDQYQRIADMHFRDGEMNDYMEYSEKARVVKKVLRILGLSKNPEGWDFIEKVVQL